MTAPNAAVQADEGDDDPLYVMNVVENEPGPAGGAGEPGGSQAPSPQPGAPPESGAAEPGAQPSAPPAPAAPAAGQPAAPQAAAALQDFPPYTYRVGREEFEIPGSKQGSEGVFFPANVMRQVGHLLSQGVYHERNWQREKSQIEQQYGERLRAAEEKAVRADATLAALDRVRQLGPEGVAKWLDDLDRNWPLMMAQAEQQILRQQLAESQKGAAERAEVEQAEVMAPQMEERLMGAIEQLCADPRAAGLDPKWFYNRMVSGFLDQLFIEAPADDPARGIRKGQVVMNADVLVREAEYELERRHEAAAAARANAQTMGTRQGQPTVGAAGTPAPGTETEGRPQFAGATLAEKRANVDEWLTSGGWKKHYPG